MSVEERREGFAEFGLDEGLLNSLAETTAVGSIEAE
jgi:hypothetical protein